MYEIAQGVVFRRHETGIDFLVLKRAPEDGGFWQAITGTIEDGELALETLERELMEEAGISEAIHISDMLEEYFWEIPEQNMKGKDHVYAVEVAVDMEVVLDPTEHTEFRWLPLADALELLRYDGNKKTMQLVSDYAARRAMMP